MAAETRRPKKRTRKRSKNSSWKNESFRNYADYMERSSFREGIEELIQLGTEGTVAIMCAEAVLEMPPVHDIRLLEIKRNRSHTHLR